MNNISIMGRLTADPELRYTTNQIEVTTFTVAVTRPYVKETTDFFTCVAWRKTAETIEKYFKKGKMIAVTGIMTSRKYEDKEGKNHKVWELQVERFEFCGDKAKQDHDEKLADENKYDMPEGLEIINDDDIPF